MTSKRSSFTANLPEITNLIEEQISLVNTKCSQISNSSDSQKCKNNTIVTNELKTQINPDLKVSSENDLSYLNKWQNIFNDSTNNNIESLDKMIMKKQKHFDIDSNIYTRIWNEEKSNFITQMNQSFNDYIAKHNLSHSLEKFEDFHKNGLSKEIRLLLNPCKELELELGGLEVERLREAKEIWSSLKSYIENHNTIVNNKRSKLESKVEKLSMLSKQIGKTAEKYAKFK